MLMRSMLLAAAVAIAVPPVMAQQNKKPLKKGKQVVNAPKHRHQCKVGPYEKQTRLVMETVKDKPVYIAYWSSNGPFHCSFETWPGDGRARWTDSTTGTVINLISGSMLIEKNGDKYFIHARDVARMPYCGTFGSINGVLTVPARRGACDWRETGSEDSRNLFPEPTEPEPQTEPAPPTEPAPAAQTAAAGGYHAPLK
ncbi:MAG: hypothetical protein EHM59_05670 [Betaproteobacteria bacterium]|nr:MAG: hypothetical protein EHM59_05670 [Betaproteobacteria bacterium]